MAERRTAIWVATAFLTSLVLAAATLMWFGAAIEGTRVALRITARWSYALFWPAYAGGALATLFGTPFEAIARRGRELGLAYAAAHLVHVALVVWLYRISPGPPVGAVTLVIFSIALFFTYLLAALSSARVAALIAPGLLRPLRLVGSEYIALAFLKDFLVSPFHQGLAHLAAYLPFLALAGIGAALRILAVAKRRRATQRASSP